MKQTQPRSFKENIRDMFTRYSLIPVFAVTCFLLLLIMGVWRYSTIHTNRRENEEKTQLVNDVTWKYIEALESFSTGTAFPQREEDAKKRSLIFQTMYQLAQETGFSAKVYVFDEEKRLLFGSTDTAPIYLSGEEYDDWGVWHKLEQEPKRAAVHVNTTGAYTLCIGKRLGREDMANGYMIVVLEPTAFTRMMSDYTAQTVVTDENGWVFINNNYKFLDNLGRFDAQKTVRGCYVTRQEACGGRLLVYSISDTSTSVSATILILATVLIIFSAITLITYLSINRMTEESTSDIEKIAYAFARVKEGNLDTYLDIDSSIEFQTIGTAYNLMLDSLKEQIATNIEMAEHVAFAQVKQLESQFNPHFIFNTLDNIRFMMKMDENAADKMLVALSKLLRYSISNAGEVITLKEDLSYTESYLTIVKIRFNRRLTYKIDIEASIMDCMIPKLIIQPLIENAIKYGFADRENLHVTVKGYEKQDKLIFVCEDDGAGIEPELLQEIQQNLMRDRNESSHMGLYNIHRRIHLLYKDIGNYGIRIESTKGQGATVTLILPVIRQKG